MSAASTAATAVSSRSPTSSSTRCSRLDLRIRLNRDRKILAFFLIDPTHRVLSTANVPAQRLDWFERQMDVSREVLGRLPVELKMMVYEEISDFPISIEGAKMFREELMERRREYVVQSNTDWAAYVFSLCEH